ncbi:MAG: cytochrome b [Armatimonadota bacterium]
MARPSLKSVAGFFTERFPREKLNYHDLVEKKTVPEHRMTWAYYLGGLALFFFVIQVLTGLLLLIYYKPTVSDAHASVRYLTEYVPNGALIRNMHAWAASFMIFFVLAHFLTTLAMKAFGRPREITWIAGVLMLFLAFAFGFTGYLLPWSQISVNATKVVLQSIEEVGQYLPSALAGLPTALRYAIQGEASIGQATLSRFFAIHVLVLPLILGLTLGLHLLSIQLHGMSQGVDKPTGRAVRFFPNFALRDARVWMAAFLVLFIAALCVPFESFLPFPLLQPFNALGSTPAGIKPEWYFFPVYYPMEMLPFWVIVLGMTGLSGGLFLVPWLLKGTTRKTLGALAVLGALYLFVITLFGHHIYTLVKGGQ